MRGACLARFAAASDEAGESNLEFPKLIPASGLLILPFDVRGIRRLHVAGWLLMRSQGLLALRHDRPDNRVQGDFGFELQGPRHIFAVEFMGADYGCIDDVSGAEQDFLDGAGLILMPPRIIRSFFLP